MKHIGVITEYNPFHNGHAYQLQQIKNLFPERKTIVIMSGNYVQRGEPAIYNKYLRAECALQSGADFIFELPALFASASAEHFASAAVLALSKTGLVDTLCFGAETDDLEALTYLAHLLAEEPSDYRAILQKHLKTGLSFPKARSAAIAQYLKNDSYSEILKHPNNILGIEYIKAIKRYQLSMQPVIIKRIGSHYHDTTATQPLSSATALRNLGVNNITALEPFIPESAYRILQNSPYAKPLFLSDFYPILQYALWQKKSFYESYVDVPVDVANQLRSLKNYPATLEQLTDYLSSRNYTKTRIQRALLNILLEQHQTDITTARDSGYISYLRLLGFKRQASSILKDVQLPIINKVSNASKLLPNYSISYFEKELQINQLYNQIFYNKYGISIPSEYEHSVIISE